MKIYQLLILSIMLVMITMGANSAADNATQNDLMTASDSSDILEVESYNIDENSTNDETQSAFPDFDVLRTSEDDLTGNNNPISYDGKYYLFRGDCWTIVNNFESSVAVTSETLSDLNVTGTFRTQNDYIGLYWYSQDIIQHPYISYGNRCDYTDVILEFDFDMDGCMDFSNGNINMEIANNAGQVYYFTMARFIENNHVRLDFNNLTLDPNDPNSKLNITDLKYLKFELKPTDFVYSDSQYTIIENRNFTCKIFNITVENGEITSEQPALDPHQYRLCEGYDDIYNLNPYRLAREMRKLGYVDWVDLYVGASYYYEKSGIAGDLITDMNFNHNRTEKMVLDKNVPLNNAFKAWLECYSRELKKNNVTNLIISVSMENLQCPVSWRQMDYNGTFAMTGWNPSTFFFSPCNDEVIAYMKNVSEACLDIVVGNGLRPILQMGEAWWWWNEFDVPNKPPCFYDNATKEKYLAEHGTAIPEYTGVESSDYDESVGDWLNKKLCNYSDALCEVVKSSKYSDGLYMALFFTPSVIDKDEVRVPQMIRDANYIKDAYSPSKLDVLQIEDYDWVIFKSPHHSEAYTIGQELGFRENQLHYFGGFVENGDNATTFWPLIEKAMEDALEKNFEEVYVWAGLQVRRDNKILGYDEYVITQNLLTTNQPGTVSPIITSPDYVNATDNFTISMRTDEWVGGVFSVYEYQGCEKGKLLTSSIISNGNSSVVLSTIVGGLNKFYLEFNYTGGNYHLIQEVYVYKLASNLTSDNINVDYNDDNYLIVTLKDEKGRFLGDKNVTIKLNGTEYTIKTNNTGQASLPINITCGNYTAEISFDEDETYKSSNTTANITVNRIESILEINDVEFDYNTSFDVNVITEGATGITAQIDGNDVNVTGNTIPISGLNASTYNLTVTTIPDENHTAVTRSVNVTVRRINSTLNISDVTMDYGKSIDVNVTTEGTTGITAQINGKDLSVDNYTIHISDLNATTYNLTVTTIPDGNHLAVNKTVTVTVNKVNSTLSVEDITLDYGDSVEVNATTQWTKGITAQIDGRDTTVNDYTIPISGLNASTYNLTVTTIPDDNHLSVNKTVTITVNKINSTLNVSDVTLNFDDTIDVNVTTNGTTGITAQIDGKNVSVSGYTIPISGLNATTHKLTVTTIPDNNHVAVNKTVTVTVNKIDSILNVSNVTMDYGDSVDVVVSTVGAKGISAQINGKDISVNDFSIPISGLNATTYNLTVTTIPDDNHLEVTKTVTITFNKVDSILNLSEVTMDYGTSLDYNVICEGADAITAQIDGEYTKVNGFVIPISGLNAENYILTVTTIPDSNHLKVSDSVTITVNRVNSSLEVDNVVKDYGTSVKVPVKAEGATGITAKLNGSNIAVEGYEIPISGLNVGPYDLTVTTVPDRNHIAVSKTVKVTVNKVNSTIDIDDVVMDYDTSVDIDVKTEGATGITAKLNGKDTSVSGFVIPISGLDADTYDLTVTTIPDKNHIEVSKTVKVTVNKVNSTLTVKDVALDYASSIDVNVTGEGTTGITAKINGKDTAVRGFVIPISGLDADTYDLTVTTIPDDNHLEVTKTVTLTVRKIKSSIKVNDTSLDYGKSIDMPVITEGANGFRAKIDGKDVAVSTDSVPVSNLKAGDHSLTVTTIPDSNHIEVSKTVTITVNKVKSTIEVDDINMDYGKSCDVEVTTNGATGITAKINTEKAMVTGNTITIPVLNAGTYNLTVTSIPDENHTSVDKTVAITVNKVNSTLDVNDVEMYYGETKNVEVSAKGSTGISAKLNGKDIAVEGYIIPISGLTPNTYVLTVTTVPDANHIAVSKSVNVVVNKLSTNLKADNVNARYSDDANLTVTLKDVKGNILASKYVLINLNGLNKTLSTDKNGQVSLPIDLKPGSYDVEIQFTGDDCYLPSATAASIIINKLATKIASSDVDAIYGDDASLIIILRDEKDNKVVDKDISININGTLHTAKTNSAGQATLPIELACGNYAADIKFSEDDLYKSSSANVKIVVNKISTQLYAPNVVATYGFASNLVITLKDEKGRALSGQKVTININKKAYNRFTDTKGQVIFAMNLAANKYYPMITFAGEDIYKSSTYTAKVIFNKAAPKIVAASKAFKAKLKTKKVYATLKNKNLPVKKAIVKLTVNKKTYKAKTNSKGIAVFIVKLTKKGKYNAVYTFAGNSNYKAATKKVKIIIK